LGRRDAEGAGAGTAAGVGVGFGTFCRLDRRVAELDCWSGVVVALDAFRFLDCCWAGVWTVGVGELLGAVEAEEVLLVGRLVVLGPVRLLAAAWLAARRAADRVTLVVVVVVVVVVDAEAGEVEAGPEGKFDEDEEGVCGNWEGSWDGSREEGGFGSAAETWWLWLWLWL